MKAVFLLAGLGRRLGALTEKMNKALIPLSGRPMLEHLIERFIKSDINKIVVVVGHDKDGVLDLLQSSFKNQITLEVAENYRYLETNNMYSIFCAREYLDGKEFILCNGDMILNRDLIRMISEQDNRSVIAVDDHRKFEQVDSPKTVVEGGKLTDLGRHIPIEINSGYAIGLYRFNIELSKEYFKEIEEMLSKGEENAGFHDPLITLFSPNEVYPMSTGGRSWADIDVVEDIEVAEQVLYDIQKEEETVL